MEEIIGGIFHIIGRFLIWFFLDIFFQVVCWGLGWGTLKIITLGQYPKKQTSEEAVAIAGFIALLLPIIFITFYFHFVAN